MIAACFLWTTAPRHGRFALYCLGRICPYVNGLIPVSCISVSPAEVCPGASLIDPFVIVLNGSWCPLVFNG